MFRPIKYSLFPPLGLATLAAYTALDDEVSITDEHVEKLRTDDAPDLVVIQVYITSALRAYRIADAYRRKGCYVVLGGLHVTSLPEEAAAHAYIGEYVQGGSSKTASAPLLFGSNITEVHVHLKATKP